MQMMHVVLEGTCAAVCQRQTSEHLGSVLFGDTMVPNIEYDYISPFGV